MVTTRGSIYSPIALHGRRIVLRTLNENDYDGWLEVESATTTGCSSGSRVRHIRRTWPKINEAS